MLASQEEAFKVLADLAIPYEQLDHVPITSVANLGFTLPGQQVKNLFLKNKKGRKFYLVLLHDEKQADLGHLADVLGEKKLSFAHDDQVRELLRVEPGTIMPLSLMFDDDHKVELIVDQAVDQSTTIGVHPFINTMTLNIAFKDFERFLKKYRHTYRVVDC